MSISNMVLGAQLYIAAPPGHIVLDEGGYVSSGPPLVPFCVAALCRVDVVGWVGAWGTPLQGHPLWGGTSLVHSSEELLVGATPASLLDIMCSQSGDWLFVLQGNLSSSGTEQKFADSAFSVPQLFVKVKKSFGN